MPVLDTGIHVDGRNKSGHDATKNTVKHAFVSLH
jgi:hypothetical protein